MKTPIQRFTVASGCLLVACIFSTLSAKEILRPLRTDTPPIIDGRLDDAIWQVCPSVTNFKTFAPDFGRDGSGKTIGYMAYDSENLYFAFRCFDGEPDKIKSVVSSRDNVGSDDWVCINLDSFNDQQSLYAFYVNPDGIQMDSRFAAGREDFSADIVWYSAGQKTPDGYTIEMQIPLRSIRYSETNPVQMSVFFERYITRLSEHSSYPELNPAKGMNFLPQMTPLLYPDVKHFSLLDILPAVTYSQKYKLDAGKLIVDENKGDFSLTATYGLTSDLILDGTYNPDFSQVEADAGQVDVNLRSALFYPEKRPFFLEGSEIYNVAATQMSAIDPVVSVVHTRMMVNPLVGGKLSGKIDAKNTIASLYVMDEVPSDERTLSGDYSHFPIFRYKRSLAEDSYLGAIYAGRELKDRYNRVLGVDGMLRATQASMVQFNGLYSATKLDAATKQAPGYSVSADFSHGTRDLDFSLSANTISEDFATESGYVTRTGLLGLSGMVRPKIYPQGSMFQRISFELVSAQTRDKFARMWETYNHVAIRPAFLGAMNATLLYAYATEIFAGESFNTGGGQASVSGLVTKQVRTSLSFRAGSAIYYSSTPYQGRSSRASAAVIYQPTANLETNVSFVYSDFYRASNSEKVYEYPIARAKITYQMNKYLFFRGILEYNKYRGRMLTDFLASFTYIPGTVAHAGYGSLYERVEWDNTRGSYVSSDRFLESQRGFFFKMSYLWRM
ncbi:MAG: DUF5916 domain-containing protein [Ignavibacteriales bacterium]|nr:DUF5916 domain-containing protein [Ignavibacteriales bacterium]